MKENGLQWGRECSGEVTQRREDPACALFQRQQLNKGWENRTDSRQKMTLIFYLQSSNKRGCRESGDQTQHPPLPVMALLCLCVLGGGVCMCTYQDIREEGLASFVWLDGSCFLLRKTLTHTLKHTSTCVRTHTHTHKHHF